MLKPVGKKMKMTCKASYHAEVNLTKTRVSLLLPFAGRARAAGNLSDQNKPEVF